MIKKVSNYFFNNENGIIVDNAYDAYTLNRLIEHYVKNDVLFIQSQDHDLNYLDRFANVEFLSLPQEAFNFDKLNELNNLKGLSIYSSKIHLVDEKILNGLEFLDIIYDDKTDVDFKNFKSLKSLRVVNCPAVKLSVFNSLEYLELNYCKKITTLDFLNQLKSIRHLRLSYLPALTNINSLKKFNQYLERIDIYDCRKIDNLDLTLSVLKKLNEIQITTLNDDRKMKFKSLNFINELLELEVFVTNYKIEDGDLSYLLNLKDVTIVPFYSHYNLKDKELPHKEVEINDKGIIKRVKLCSLEDGKNDSRIIWEN